MIAESLDSRQLDEMWCEDDETGTPDSTGWGARPVYPAPLPETHLA